MTLELKRELKSSDLIPGFGHDRNMHGILAASFQIRQLPFIVSLNKEVVVDADTAKIILCLTMLETVS